LNKLHDQRIQYYLDKQDICIENLTNAHLKLYEEQQGRSLNDYESTSLFHHVYMSIKNILENNK